MTTDALAGFEAGELTHDGTTRPVFRAGEGPGVVVIHEIPGITPGVAAFARRLVDRGFHVVLPSLIGTPGRPISGGYLASSMARLCVSREFHCLALRSTSPVAEWLRALARDTHERCGGPGVGAVGMCFSGGFSLAMAVDPAVVAPVLSQPALPFPMSARHRADIGLSDAEAAVLADRAGADACEALGLRFTADATAPAERFASLRALLGDAFTAIEIDSAPGNPHSNPRRAHSVLTEHLVDEPGHPTRDALEAVFDLFERRLRPGA